MSSNVISPSEQSIYDICQEQYDYAVNKCDSIYNNLNNVINKLLYENKIIRKKNSYHFKYMHRDTNNGIHVCIPPYNNTIELYYIFNNKRDNNNIIIDSNYEIDDIIYHLKKCMFNNETQEIEIKDRCNELSSYFNSISNEFNVNINRYNINIIDKNTNNGYNLSINLNSKNYIYIRIIQNNTYYNNMNYNYFANSYEHAINYLRESILNKKHNSKMKCYKIINTRYLDNSEETQNIIYNTLFNINVNNNVRDQESDIVSDPE
jgi:hypothetical protein